MFDNYFFTLIDVYYVYTTFLILRCPHFFIRLPDFACNFWLVDLIEILSGEQELRLYRYTTLALVTSRLLKSL